MTTMDAESFAAMQRMRAATNLRPLDPANFVITQPEHAPSEPAANQPPPAAAAGWDPAAFDVLPPEQRAAVMSGVAATIGRQAVEHAAAGELINPADVHHHLPNPEQYVDANGVIDHSAIRTAVTSLATSHAHLFKHGAPSTTQRQAPPGIGGGTGGHETEAEKTASSLARMREMTRHR